MRLGLAGLKSHPTDWGKPGIELTPWLEVGAASTVVEWLRPFGMSFLVGAWPGIHATVC